METAHLKAFLRIAETGSISRAAESLGVSQPSLSQQLLRLEDEVGIRLFDRTARGVILTESGRVFREHARAILHAAEQAVADARHMREEARGQVVFAMPPSVAQLLAPRLIETLARVAPLLRVRVVEAFCGTIRGWIEAEKIDLGVVYDLGRLPHLVQEPLASDELVVVGPHRRLDAEIPFAALAQERLVAPGPQHGLRQVLEREAARRSLSLNIVQEADSLGATLGLVATGHGLAVMPRCAVDPGRFGLARIGSEGLRRRLCFVRNPAHVLTHASVRTADLTRSVAASVIDGGQWPATLESAPHDD